MTIRSLSKAALCLGALSLPSLCWAQEAAQFFRQHCVSCHTIGGGRLTGPDLKNVTEQKERDWLVRFMGNPRAMIDSGDPYAQQLFEDSRRVVMPTIEGMTPERANALLDLITAESQLQESQFKGLQISDRPFTPNDIEAGREIFLGQRKLANGAPACLSCHTMRGIGGLGGGRLGPDLTRAFERLGGRKSMGAWLFAPATTTMGPLFTKHPLQPEEILPLLAYFESTAQAGGEGESVALLNFFFLGLGGTVLALVIFDALWKKRFRGVRAALVERRAARGEL